MGAERCLSDGGGQAEELLHMRVTAACENDFDAAQRACRGREGGCSIRLVESTVVGGEQARSQLGRRVMQSYGEVAGLAAGGGSCAPSLIGSVQWKATIRVEVEVGVGLSGAELVLRS